MNRPLAGALAMGLGLGIALAGPAGAQIQIDANGGSNAYPGGGTTVSSNDGGDVILGDIYSGPGGTTISTSSSPGPVTVSSRPEPAPAPAATEDGGSEEADSGGDWILAEPTPEDQDADNYPDADEPAAGLDPADPDTDGDSIADGDEVNIFGTDPVLYDTDGDGVMDGDELWWTETDPLDPNDYALSAAQPASEPAASERAPEPQVTSTPRDNANVTVADGGNATSYGEGSATSAPGSVIQGADVTLSDIDAGLPSQCSAYPDWYAAQTNYENAGGVQAADSLVNAVDADRDGIACEEMMEQE